MIVEVLGKEMFDKHVSESKKLVIVDFWAEWCGPCRLLKPVLHDMATTRDDIELLTVDVDAAENADLTMQFSVRSIPQVTMFMGGEQVDQFVGALPPEQIEALIAKHVSATVEGVDAEKEDGGVEGEE